MKNLTDVPNIDVLSAYFLQKPLERKVGRDCLVTYANAKYSVPIEFIGKTVIVEESNKKLNIFYNNKLICTHPISEKLFNYFPEHYRQILSTIMSNADEIEKQCAFNLEIFDALDTGGNK